MNEKKELIYRIEIYNRLVFIYINDTLHLLLEQEGFKGIQSYKDGTKAFRYVIEYYYAGLTITTEYDALDKWQSILNLISTNIHKIKGLA
jgi:hypothetical protein